MAAKAMSVRQQTLQTKDPEEVGKARLTSLVKYAKKLAKMGKRARMLAQLDKYKHRADRIMADNRGWPEAVYDCLRQAQDLIAQAKEEVSLSEEPATRKVAKPYPKVKVKAGCLVGVRTSYQSRRSGVFKNVSAMTRGVKVVKVLKTGRGEVALLDPKALRDPETRIPVSNLYVIQ